MKNLPCQNVSVRIKFGGYSKLFAPYLTLGLHCEFSSRQGFLPVAAYYSSYASQYYKKVLSGMKNLAQHMKVHDGT